MVAKVHYVYSEIADRKIKRGCDFYCRRFFSSFLFSNRNDEYWCTRRRNERDERGSVVKDNNKNRIELAIVKIHVLINIKVKIDRNVGYSAVGF